eukprot:scaffold247923_cov28-Tisochrysis_lutea.AAC.1
MQLELRMAGLIRLVADVLQERTAVRRERVWAWPTQLRIMRRRKTRVAIHRAQKRIATRDG